MISKPVLRVILKAVLILSIIKHVKGNKVGDPIFLGEIQNRTVSEGGNVTFACRVDNLGSYIVAWMNYEKSELLTVSNFVITRDRRITVSHDKHQKAWYLHISEARKTDSGKYMCQINTNSLMTIAGYLLVAGNKVGDPIFLGEIQNRTVSEGGNVTFACRVDNLGSHKVAWINYQNYEMLTLANHVITRDRRITVSHDKHQKTWYLHISEAKETDSGKYVCVINTDSAMTIAGYLLVAGNKVRDPIFLGEILNHTVSEGRNVRFACSVDNLGSHRVVWMHGESFELLTLGIHVITRNQRITVSHDKHKKTWYLHISEARETDSGKYMCQIHTVPTRTIEGYLTVIVPPDIVDHESTGYVNAQEGSDVHLWCEARGPPRPVVTWKREDNKNISVNNSNKLTEVVSQMLILRKVRRMDMGAYLCIASNGHPQTVRKRILVTVYFPPTLWIPHEMVGADIGSTVTLECFIEAHPTSLNYWTRGDSNMIYDSDKYKFETRMGNREYKTHMLLTVRHMEEEDFGVYRCIAKNALGESEDHIRVYNSGPPPTTSEIQKAKENIDEKKDSGPPPTTSEIQKAKENIDEKKDSGTPPTTSEIQNAKENIDEKNVPPMLWIPHQLIEADIGSTVTLECFIESHQPSVNYWTRRDGDMIYDSDKYKIENRMGNPEYKIHMLLTVRHLEEEDFRTYRCFAMNSRGETNGSIKVYNF